MNWFILAAVVVVVVGVTMGIVQISGQIKKMQALVKERSGRYQAVIQDIVRMKGWQWETKLLLRIETPEGPIGEYLIVPLTQQITAEFLQDARVTQRPILVECCVDRSIEYAYRQHGTVLGLA